MADINAKMDDILYPEDKPYNAGHLDVGSGHKIYYEEFGNKDGIPVVYLHGGPGAGHAPYFHRFFDPKAFHVVVFDQRGAGQSTPFAKTEDNNPDLCAQDTEMLKKHLGIDKWHVFGGSWGSTLGLLYAETYPDSVKSLTLRGIFLMRQKELDMIYKDGDRMFPEEFSRLKNFIPKEEQGDLLRAYYNRISKGDKEAAKVWTRFESATCHLLSATDAELDAEPDNFTVGMATMETSFFVNHMFQPEDRLLRDVGRIRHIPTMIVQGQYDCVCPPVSAWELKQAFPEAQLQMTISGHSAGDPEISKALRESADRIRDTGSPLPPRKPARLPAPQP